MQQKYELCILKRKVEIKKSFNLKHILINASQFNFLRSPRAASVDICVARTQLNVRLGLPFNKTREKRPRRRNFRISCPAVSSIDHCCSKQLLVPTQDYLCSLVKTSDSEVRICGSDLRLEGNGLHNVHLLVLY